MRFWSHMTECDGEGAGLHTAHHDCPRLTGIRSTVSPLCTPNSGLQRWGGVNDNDPVFTQPVYELRLNEDAAVGSSVLTLRALDRDANSVITYQLTGGNTRNRFALSSQSGGGLITLALPLDYKQERQYVLAVTASDGMRSHTAQVFINVTDANTHRPVFQSSHYTVSVSEDRPVGTSIATISATDEDTGENARITYVLEDPVPQFRIDPDTGTVYTMTELDYEDQAAYTLAITARDNGIPQKSDTTSLEILILDANDNVPRFLRDFYQGSVFEDAPPSTSVQDALYRCRQGMLGLLQGKAASASRSRLQIDADTLV